MQIGVLSRSLCVDPCFTGVRSCLPADRVYTYADYYLFNAGRRICFDMIMGISMIQLMKDVV